ncbi:hypothetical protein C454_15600 [Haloferax gibbonsii ATCC 33959]|uniref:Uncharacterized protein n=2 Tax=Haloferax gibbonsii TaxID=35746 RepID=M0H0A7_HALGM|nr:hypothetical protein C454_15600 [Haloferax gibbonsii ATCC 33959]
MNYANLAEAQILSGDIEDGLKNARTAIEKADSRSREAEGLLQLIIGKIFAGEDYHEEKEEFEEICKEGIRKGWEFDEIHNRLEEGDISEEQEKEINEIEEIYKDGKEINTIGEYIVRKKENELFI